MTQHQHKSTGCGEQHAVALAESILDRSEPRVTDAWKQSFLSIGNHTPMVEGDCILFNGNCFDVMKEMQSDGIKVAAVITDMPYGNTSAFWDKKAPPLSRFWNATKRLTIPFANFVLFCCGRFTHELYNSNPEWYRYDLVWHKIDPVGFHNANLMPMRNHETILVFGREGKKAATFNPVMEFNERNVGVKSGGGKNSGDGRSVYGKCNTVESVSDGWMYPRSVISCKRDTHGKNRFHCTQKPVDLMAWLILTYTNEGDLVFDPFMGSGSTGAACARLNRRFIGIEMDQWYFKSAVKRIRAVTERRG